MKNISAGFIQTLKNITTFGKNDVFLKMLTPWFPSSLSEMAVLKILYVFMVENLLYEVKLFVTNSFWIWNQ